MTQRTRTLVWAAISLAGLAGLLLYAYFGVHRAKQDEERTEKLSKMVFDFDPALVTKLEVEAGGERTVCEKSGVDDKKLATWNLLEPVRDDGDSVTVNGLIGTVNRLDFTDKISGPDAAALDRFGLDKPHGRVVLTLADGKALVLKVGKRNSFANKLYLQKEGDPDVLAVQATMDASLLKKTFDLRRKELGKFETEQVSQFSLSDGKNTVELEKQGEGWQITAPIKDTADKNEVSIVLNNLHNLRAVSFPAGDRFKPFGLDPPAVTAQLRFGADLVQVLELGAGAADSNKGKFFARRKDPPGPVGEIREYQLKAVQKTAAFALQAKAPLDFEQKAVFEIKDSSDRELIVLEKKLLEKPAEGKTPARTEDSWSLVSPGSGPAKLFKVNSFLTGLSGLRATKFLGDKDKGLAAFGLDKPVRTIALFDKDGKELGTLQIGKSVEEGTYVAGTARPQVCLVDKAKIAQFPATAKDLEDNPAGAPPAPSPLLIPPPQKP